jgi:GntR family transcriptional regulator / MocR family aminotransferase
MTRGFFELAFESATAAGGYGAARALYGQIRSAILQGRLSAGAKLPATRQAVAVFKVSRNTLAKAYELLLREGLVQARRGSGTYVIEPTPKSRLQGLMRRDATSDGRLNPFWQRTEVATALGFWAERTVSDAPRRTTPGVDFRPALVDARLFPLEDFRRVSAKALRQMQKRPARHKGPYGNQGSYSLRRAITDHVAQMRAISCEAEEVLITSGAQQAFDLLARVLVIANETVVAFEDPGYPPMRVAFAAAGAKMVPCAVDEEGLIVEELPPDVSVICVCPSHQFPLGMTMSKERRRALIAFARRRRAAIVEDDYDGEFRHGGEPIDALRSLDAADVVLYVGTFSKSMLPSLRLGFLIASGWAMNSLIAAKNCLDWHCSVPIQLAVGTFIADGHLRRHVHRLRRLYQTRRRALLEGLEDGLAEWLLPIPSPYGMHVTTIAQGSTDLRRLTQDLLAQNIHLHTLERYYYGRQTLSGLIFGLGVADAGNIRSGLTALRRIFHRRALSQQ